MHAKRHAMLAAMLIEANGGLEKSSNACRLSVAHLQRFQDKNFDEDKPRHYMPADVIADLEDACGRRIYSGAMAHKRITDDQVDDLQTETMELTEDAALLMRLVRLAAADGVIDEVVEGPKIDRFLEMVEQRVADLRAARVRGRST